MSIGLDKSQAHPLPITSADITASWLTGALQVRHPGITVRDLRLEEVYLGASGIFRAFVKYDQAQWTANMPATLMVKGGFRPHSEHLAELLRMEANFYGRLQGQVTLRTPKCYYAGIDPGGFQSVLILEDLATRKVFFPRYTTCTSDFGQATARIRALAQLHAETWNSPRFAPGGDWDWVQPRFGGFIEGYIDAIMSEEFWKAQMATPQGAACSRKLHNLDWMRHALDKLKKRDETEPNCLLHGDAHMGNTYIELDGTPGFVDPNPCRSHWSTEVAYSLCTSLDSADRPRWEGPLIALYLDALASHGITPPSFDEAYKSYSCAIAYGYWGFVVNSTEYQTSAVNTTGAARFAAAALHNNTVELLS